MLVDGAMSSRRGYMPRSKGDNWQTPPELYAELDKEFHFDFDPCPLNPDGLRAFDGLGAWGERSFVNPPHSMVADFVRHGLEESRLGKLVVMLLPARTDTAWFHECVLPYAEIRFLRGRLKFGTAKAPAPFPSMVVIFRPGGSIRH